MKLILQKEIDTKIFKFIFTARKIKIFLVFTHFSTFLKTTSVNNPTIGRDGEKTEKSGARKKKEKR